MISRNIAVDWGELVVPTIILYIYIYRDRDIDSGRRKSFLQIVTDDDSAVHKGEKKNGILYVYNGNDCPVIFLKTTYKNDIEMSRRIGF